MTLPEIEYYTGISVNTTTVPMAKGQDFDPCIRVVNDESHNITDPWLRHRRVDHIKNP